MVTLKITYVNARIRKNIFMSVYCIVTLDGSERLPSSHSGSKIKTERSCSGSGVLFENTMEHFQDNDEGKNYELFYFIGERNLLITTFLFVSIY